MHRHAVVCRTRFEPVAQRQRQIACLPVIRLFGAGPLIVGNPEQIGACHRQQFRGAVPLLAPPGVEVPRRHHTGGNPRVVERVDLVIAGEQVAPPGPLLEFGHLGAQPEVLGEEVMAGLPVTVDKCVPDEQFACQHRIHGRVPDLPARHQGEAVEGDALERDDVAARGVPARLAVAALHQITGDPLHRLRVDAGGHPAVEPAGLHQIGHHHPAGRPSGQHRAGCQHEAHVAGAGVLAGISLTQADVREQAGDQSGVHPRRIGRLTVARFPDADVAGDSAQLAGEILPLPDPQVMQELLAAHPAECAAGQCFALREQIAPQVEIGHEVACLVGEPGVFGPRGLFGVSGTLARIRYRQCGGEHENLRHAALGIGLQDHPAEPGVHRKPSQPPAQGGDVTAGVERAEFPKQRHPVADAAALRRIEETEALHIAETQCGHLQHHRRQVGAQDLRIGVALAGFEVLLGVQPDAHTRRGPAGSPRPLSGGGLRDGFDRQALDLGSPAVAGDARGAGVDDVADTGNGERGLGHVGGQNDPARQPVRVGREDLLLLCGRQARVERQHLHIGQPGAHRFGGVADLPLAGQEDQHVAGRLGCQLFECVDDRLGLIARFDPHHLVVGVVGIVTVGGVGDRVQRAVTDLDREGASGHLDDRCAAVDGREVRGEPFRLDRR